MIFARWTAPRAATPTLVVLVALLSGGCAVHHHHHHYAPESQAPSEASGAKVERSEGDSSRSRAEAEVESYDAAPVLADASPGAEDSVDPQRISKPQPEPSSLAGSGEYEASSSAFPLFEGCRVDDDVTGWVLVDCPDQNYLVQTGPTMRGSFDRRFAYAGELAVRRHPQDVSYWGKASDMRLNQTRYWTMQFELRENRDQGIFGASAPDREGALVAQGLYVAADSALGAIGMLCVQDGALDRAACQRVFEALSSAEALPFGKVPSTQIEVLGWGLESADDCYLSQPGRIDCMTGHLSWTYGTREGLEAQLKRTVELWTDNPGIEGFYNPYTTRRCELAGQVHLSNLCTEIIEVSSAKETAVCNLGSINLARHTLKNDEGEVVVDYDKLAQSVRTAVVGLDRVIDLNYYPIPSTAASNDRWRPVGLGLMGLQDVFFQMKLPFDSPKAQAISKRISEEMYYHALSTSADLAEAHGAHEAFEETRAARGQLQFDLWGVSPEEPARWEALRARIQEVGLRNSLLCAIAPTATIASIAGCYECIEPQVSNLFKRETLSGDFVQVNRYLVAELQRLGLWDERMRARLKNSEGSVQAIDELPEELRQVYRTAWELPMRSLIGMAADRGAFIDQSQSLNLFIESPTLGQLSSMYLYAWKRGLKTTYYLRSRPATRITKTTVEVFSREAIACSLENPEICEACQ